MKQFLIYAIPALMTVAACNKNQPAQQDPIRLVTLSVGSPQKAVSSSATVLAAPAALGTPAEFTLSGSPVKANGAAAVSVENAQLSGVNTATGSVVGVVKLTFNNLIAADDVISAQLKTVAKGDAVVQVAAAVPTALKDGKLATPLTTTAVTITPASNSNELFLLFQSGVNGFSEADEGVVEITAKDTKFMVTIKGKGSKAKAVNQTAVNKVVMRTGEKEKTAKVKSGGTKVCAPADLTTSTKEFTLLNRANAATVGVTSVADVNILITNTNKGDFKAAESGKIGIVQLIFANAKKLAGSSGGTSSPDISFSAKIKSITPTDASKQGKVALVNAEPTADKELFISNALKDSLMANAATNGGNDKWSDYTAGSSESNTSSTSTSKNTWLLFQGSTTGFGDNDVVVVEITATLGTGDDMATKIFTVGISVAKAATTGAGS